jgi:predicted Zn-dependent protease
LRISFFFCIFVKNQCGGRFKTCPYQNIKPVKKLLFLIVLFSALCGCKKTPITGSRSLTLIPTPMLNSIASASYNDVRKSSQISNHAEWTAMVNNTGRRISQAVEQYLRENKMESRIKDFNWEFILIKDPTVNAWVMPGGKVAFYEGIMPICQTETGVAVVMGHEIAHVVANHGNSRMSWGLVQQLGGVSLAVAMREQPETTQALALTAFGVGSTVFGTLPYSRKNEYEADKLGMVFMAMAGYDPAETPLFWERMMVLSGNKSTSDFLSTHPANKKRIKEAQKNINFAMKYYQPQQESTTTTSQPSGTRPRTTFGR